MKAKTIKLGNREIPLKKDNTPNLRHLTKDEKVAVKKYVDSIKKAKKEVELKQLQDVLKDLI